jgi:hypothetical protein
LDALVERIVGTAARHTYAHLWAQNEGPLVALRAFLP